MGWLVAGLFGLVLLGGLIVFLRGRDRYRKPADDTLITELLGPRDVRAAPTARVRKEGEPPPAPSTPPASEGDWLETQLAWITSWSQRMHQQISSAGRPDPDREE